MCMGTQTARRDPDLIPPGRFRTAPRNFDATVPENATVPVISDEIWVRDHQKGRYSVRSASVAESDRKYMREPRVGALSTPPAAHYFLNNRLRTHRVDSTGSPLAMMPRSSVIALSSSNASIPCRNSTDARSASCPSSR